MAKGTFNYREEEYPIMDLESAASERDRRVAAGEENVCIISCFYDGGGKDDYIVVVAQKM